MLNTLCRSLVAAAAVLGCAVRRFGAWRAVVGVVHGRLATELARGSACAARGAIRNPGLDGVVAHGLIFRGSRAIGGARCWYVDAQYVIVVRREVVRAAIAHLTSIPKVPRATDHGNISSNGVRGTRRTSAHNYNRASGGLVRVVGVLGLSILQTKIGRIVALVQVFCELVGVAPVGAGDSVVEVTLVDATEANGVDVIGHM